MLNIRNLYIAVFLPIAMTITMGSVSGSIQSDRPTESTKKSNEAVIEFKIESKKINRVAALQAFFKKYNSPLSNHAETFVKIADKYKIDYKLLPSIACMESTCARFLIPGTHNPFGWGAGRIAFASYDEAIEKVGEGLDKIYLSRGLDNAEKIAPVYNPPSPLSWTKGVNFFTSKIEEISLSI